MYRVAAEFDGLRGIVRTDGKSFRRQRHGLQQQAAVHAHDAVIVDLGARAAETIERQLAEHLDALLLDDAHRQVVHPF